MTKGCIEIDCHSKFEESICPSCLKKCKKVSSVSTRRVRDMSILGKEVYLNLESRQFHCVDCSRYFQEQFSFVKPSKTNTIRLEEYLYACLKTSSFNQTWKNDILNFFTYRISNGIVEGINNAIKTLKRVAYGFRNFDHFRNRILVSFL
jgi:transposase